MDENNNSEFVIGDDMLITATPTVLRVAADMVERTLFERVVFMYALSKFMLDTGQYDLEIKKEDFNDMEGHSMLISNNDEHVKVSIVFPNQDVKKIIEE